jgi:hypothetical protein
MEGGFAVTKGIHLRILTTSEHLADDVTSAVQLANDADPTTLADRIGKIARVDRTSQMDGHTAKPICCAAGLGSRGICALLATS